MSVDKLAQLAVDVIVSTRRAIFQIKEFEKKIKQNGDNINKLNRRFTNVALGAGAFLLLNRAIGITRDTIVSTIQAASEFEQFVINIERVANTGNITQLSKDFTRIAQSLQGIGFKEFSDITVQAARLGFRGDELLDFASTVAILTRAAGDIDVQQATRDIGRITLNFGFATEEALNIASAVDLASDRFAVLTGEVTRITARLAGYAQTVGVSVEETAALSAFFIKAGSTSTEARSAFVRLFRVLTKQPLKAASALGLAGDEAQEFLRIISGQPIEGFKIFIKGLDELSQGKQLQAMKDLGIASVRMEVPLGTAVSNFKDLDRILAVVKEGMKSAENLFRKDALAANTLASSIKDLNKQWTLFKASIADTNFINRVSGFLVKLSLALGLDKKSKIPQTEFKGLQNELEQNINKQVKMSRRISGIFEETKGINDSILGPFVKGIAFWSRATKLRGELNNLEQREIQLRNQIKKQEEANVARKKRMVEEEATSAEEAAKRVQDANRDFINSLLDDLPSISLELSTFEKRLKKIDDALEENIVLAKVTNDATQVQINRFAEWEQSLLKSRAAIVAEEEARKQIIKERERERKKATRESKLSSILGVLGKPGQAIGLARQFDDFKNILPGQAANLDDIFKVGLQDIFKKEGGGRKFTGLTEAWKQAQISTNKINPIEKQQLAVAEAIKDAILKGDPADNQRNNLLKQILDKLAPVNNFNPVLR